MRMQLIDKFQDQIPDSTSPRSKWVYIEGCHQAQIRLVTDDDLKWIYEIHNKRWPNKHVVRGCIERGF